MFVIVAGASRAGYKVGTSSTQPHPECMYIFAEPQDLSGKGYDGQEAFRAGLTVCMCVCVYRYFFRISGCCQEEQRLARGSKSWTHWRVCMCICIYIYIHILQQSLQILPDKATIGKIPSELDSLACMYV